MQVLIQLIWGKVKSLHSSQAPRRCQGSGIWGEQALPTPQSCLLPTESTYEVPKPEFWGQGENMIHVTQNQKSEGRSHTPARLCRTT